MNNDKTSSLKDLLVRWESMLVGLILVVTVINSQVSPFFLKATNLSRATRDFMELGIMMLPMVFVIITANIDLSVASTMGMCASLLGLLHNQGFDIWLAAGAAIMLGALAGLLNGALVGPLKLPSLVVTLGTFAFYRGMAFAMLGDNAARGYPETFTYLGQGYVADTRIPISLVLFLALALVFGLVLHKTTFGRYMYAIGNNEEAARFSGVPVTKVKVAVFVLSGIMSALAGCLLAARFGSTRPDLGTGLELTVIATTVLGGINIFGGSGTMLGALLALVLIGLVRFGMGLVNVQGQVQDIVIGLLLVVSVMAPSIGQRLSRRPTRERSWRERAPALAFAFTLLLFVWFFFWSRSLLETF